MSPATRLTTSVLLGTCKVFPSTFCTCCVTAPFVTVLQNGGVGAIPALGRGLDRGRTDANLRPRCPFGTPELPPTPAHRTPPSCHSGGTAHAFGGWGAAGRTPADERLCGFWRCGSMTTGSTRAGNAGGESARLAWGLAGRQIPPQPTLPRRDVGASASPFPSGLVRNRKRRCPAQLERAPVR